MATYAVSMQVPGYAYSVAAWPTKHCGRPSEERLATYIADFEKSCAPGGCNAHLGVQTVKSARIFRQSTGDVVATYALR